MANSWKTHARRDSQTQPLIDYSDDLWMDAKLDEVEDWLNEHLRSRHEKKRRQNVWTMDDAA